MIPYVNRSCSRLLYLEAAALILDRWQVGGFGIVVVESRVVGELESRVVCMVDGTYLEIGIWTRHVTCNLTLLL
jgi:hypothetical protein